MNDDVDVGPASDLAYEALETVGNRLADLCKEDPRHFTVFVLFILNSWALNFMPEGYAEFCDVMANSVRQLGDSERQGLN